MHVVMARSFILTSRHVCTHLKAIKQILLYMHQRSKSSTSHFSLLYINYFHIVIFIICFSPRRTYMLTMPLITAGLSGNESTMHQDHVGMFHQSSFQSRESISQICSRVTFRLRLLRSLRALSCRQIPIIIQMKHRIKRHVPDSITL